MVPRHQVVVPVAVEVVVGIGGDDDLHQMKLAGESRLDKAATFLVHS